jgi:hypothetical protein
MLLEQNRDIANNDNLTGSLNAFLENYMRNEFDDFLPAQVVSHDRIKNRVVLQILVQMVDTNNSKKSRARLVEVPVFRFGGGGFFISVPINPGDFGWVKASDRDISLIIASGGKINEPNTKRLHKFSDALFYPDMLKGWLIDGKNADALVIQSLDGSTCIALDSGRIEMDTTSFIVNATTIQLNSTSLKHNSKNIGDTHNHPQNDGSHFGGGVDTSSPNA